MSMSILPACISVYHIHAWCPQMSEEDIGFPGAGVMNDFVLPRGVLGIELMSSIRTMSTLNEIPAAFYFQTPLRVELV